MIWLHDFESKTSQFYFTIFVSFVFTFYKRKSLQPDVQAKHKINKKEY